MAGQQLCGGFAAWADGCAGDYDCRPVVAAKAADRLPDGISYAWGLWSAAGFGIRALLV